ncbi:MAG: DUF1592 domain-containing protein [Acidobacteria bacterium]|nr:DUF1592 domain-containing protein [Acidobacteriota bacterium]
MKILFLLFAAPLLAADYSIADAQKFLKTYCHSCHQGAKPSGGFNVAKLNTMQTLLDDPRRWGRMLTRVREHQMPPLKMTQPALDAREAFSNFVDHNMKTAACADGIAPRQPLLRRLNRNEYSATIRDLLNVPIAAGHALPADGAGGEGFDNAAETLFLSPIHAEKYLDAASEALHYGVKDPRSRTKFLIADPSATVTHEQAAQKVLDAFLPRAFRRPLRTGELDRYMTLYRTAYTRHKSYEPAILQTLQGVLLSPNFLFKLEDANAELKPRLVEDFALASRLSYFLWGSMPDQTLFDLAAKGKLNDPEALREQTIRMLKDPKAQEFAEYFVEQWLGTRELGRDIKPDPKLFPSYADEEVASGMRYEPILFFHELIKEDLPLDNLIDSKFTFVSNKLMKHYEFTVPERIRQQPVKVTLPEGTHRGGLLGMAAILAVSSYPNRTSPVLRGKWILESLLGTPPPPPPPGVPPLEADAAANPKSMRERLELHRSNVVCATCHNRIDPLGFGLENYDVVGKWRDGADALGELPDGTKFNGPDGLKTLLMQRKDDFMRNLGAKMLGYALGRGLTLEDYCAVDRIVANAKTENYKAHRFILEVVRSVPFRYQPGTQLNVSVE